MANFIGLSVGEKSLLAAEVSVGRDRSELRRVAEFIYPADASLDKPDLLGEALAQFLRQKGFSASKAVAGVPARWLIAREKDVPPAREEAAVGMLKLASERLVSADLEMVFDYSGTTDSSSPTKVLLVGIVKGQLEKISAMADSAGLTLLAVTSSTLALASAADQKTGPVVVSLGSESIELAARSRGGSALMLRHLGTHALRGGGAAVSTVGSELRRAVSMVPGENGSRSMLLWDGLGLEDEHTSALGQRAGLEADLGSGMQSLGIHANGTHGEDTMRFGPAAALALAGARRELLAVDFLHSRLTIRKQSRIGRKGAWTIFIATVLVVAIGSFFFYVQLDEWKLADIKNQLASKDAERKISQNLQEKVNVTSQWFTTRPPNLEALLEINKSLRDDEPIWITSVSLRDNRKGSINGTAADRQRILTLADRLRANKKFTEVRGPDIHERGNAREKDFVFTISFIYKG